MVARMGFASTTHGDGLSGGMMRSTPWTSGQKTFLTQASVVLDDSVIFYANEEGKKERRYVRIPLGGDEGEGEQVDNGVVVDNAITLH